MKNINSKSKSVISFLLIFCFLFSFLTVVSSAKERDTNDSELILGGVPFGVKFSVEGIVVTGFSDIATDTGNRNPAYAAGLRERDIIIKVNGESVQSVTALDRILESSAGRELLVTYTRAGESKTVKLTPVYCKSDGKYKLGLTVKDGGAGIGTVTYVLPGSLMFGGLGHGICEADTGKLVKMGRGIVSEVNISGIKKGVSGTPGEIKGYLGYEKRGVIYENTVCGVFGVYTALPKNLGERVKVGTKDEIKQGEAYIVTTLDAGGVPQKYKIEISGIDKSATGAKCFCIKVTDKALIEKTGGIVQGMSGSPILQNGKLVGAVTHVLINDPTVGYGIFIENMLNQMQNAG